MRGLAANELIPMGLARRASAMLYIRDGYTTTEACRVFGVEEAQLKAWEETYIAQGYRGWLRSIYGEEVKKIGPERIWRVEAEVVDIVFNNKPPDNSPAWTIQSISKAMGIPDYRVVTAIDRLGLTKADLVYDSSDAEESFLHSKESLELVKKVRIRRKKSSRWTRKQEEEFFRLIGPTEGCRQPEVVAAHLAGISPLALLSRMDEDIRFKARVNKIKAGTKKLITDKLWQKAMGYDHPEVKEKFQAELTIKPDGSIGLGENKPSEVTKTMKHFGPDMTALVFIATNYAPETFQRQPEATVGAEGAIAKLEISDPERAREGESLAALGELGGPLPDMPEPEDVLKHRSDKAKRERLIAKRDAPPAAGAAPTNWAGLAEKLGGGS